MRQIPTLDLYDDQIAIPSLRDHIQTGHPDRSWRSAPEVSLDDYDRIVVCLSGGKDSIACVVRLLELGADRAKIELWHHLVDGREGGDLMDWPFAEDYCRKLAATWGIPIYFSWLEGGFEGELIKENAHSRPHSVETPEGLVSLPRDTMRGRPNTRLRFPQQSANLATRWCSSALKIDVGRRALNNQPRFDGARTLFVTGERAQESPGRARYQQLERHACDRRDGPKRRHVDAWRPVLHWSEADVWRALERHRVIPPVPYRLGWGRSSCLACVFNAPRIWATIARYFHQRAERIAGYERSFGATISRSRRSVLDMAAAAEPLRIDDADALAQASRADYALPVLLEDGETWRAPPGAFSQEASGAP